MPLSQKGVLQYNVPLKEPVQNKQTISTPSLHPIPFAKTSYNSGTVPSDIGLSHGFHSVSAPICSCFQTSSLPYFQTPKNSLWRIFPKSSSDVYTADITYRSHPRMPSLPLPKVLKHSRYAPWHMLHTQIHIPDCTKLSSGRQFLPRNRPCPVTHSAALLKRFSTVPSPAAENMLPHSLPAQDFPVFRYFRVTLKNTDTASHPFQSIYPCWSLLLLSDKTDKSTEAVPSAAFLQYFRLKSAR